MPAGIYDITIEQGATFSQVFTWKVDNVAVNLTGYTARMQIRKKKSSSSTLVSLTTENGGISLGGVAGTITVTITATATAALSFDTAVYDLEVVSGGGVVTRLVEGAATLNREVTR